LHIFAINYIALKLFLHIVLLSATEGLQHCL